jgi:hypothetical protein
MTVLRTYTRNVGSAEYESNRTHEVMVVDECPNKDSPAGYYQYTNPYGHTFYLYVGTTWTGDRVMMRTTKYGEII